MKKQRIDRLNSLLKEVISEVIRRDVNNPNVSEFTTVTKVDITSDLHYAKVYISIIGSPEEKQKTIYALQNSAGFIGKTSSKKIIIRYFPALTFKLDTYVEQQTHIKKILEEIKSKKSST
jgi:ribosome-binding factor A